MLNLGGYKPNVVMKKILLFLFLLLPAMVSAQEWKTSHHKADELKKTQAYDSYHFTEIGIGSFIYWSNDDTNFRIITDKKLFDYKRDGSIRYVIATIGYYDEKGKLISDEKSAMYVDDQQPDFAETLKKKTARKVIDHLTNKKGYVRILAPLYGTNLDFDLKVQCKNNDIPSK